MTANFTTMLVPQGKGATYLLLGDLYTILAEGKDTGGTYGLIEQTMQPQSMIPPHIHDEFEEAHYILEGEIVQGATSSLKCLLYKLHSPYTQFQQLSFGYQFCSYTVHEYREIASFPAI